MKQISILGCGWLGFPLAELLITKGYKVKGSTTTISKVSLLKKANIDPYVIELNENQQDVSTFLNGSEILIINIPPKLRGNGAESYVAKITSIVASVENSDIKHLLFINSTSIYGDSSEIVTEETNPIPETESGKQLLQTERILFANSHFDVTSVRLSGLIGEDRHPVRYLSGRILSEPDAPVNLIHREDCIAIIEAIIAQDSWNEIYNASYPEHPSRKDYYSRKATELRIALPRIENQGSKGKTISSQKIIAKLSYSFSKPI